MNRLALVIMALGLRHSALAVNAVLGSGAYLAICVVNGPGRNEGASASESSTWSDVHSVKLFCLGERGGVDCQVSTTVDDKKSNDDRIRFLSTISVCSVRCKENGIKTGTKRLV